MYFLFLQSAISIFFMLNNHLLSYHSNALVISLLKHFLFRVSMENMNLQVKTLTKTINIKNRFWQENPKANSIPTSLFRKGRFEAQKQVLYLSLLIFHNIWREHKNSSIILGETGNYNHFIRLNSLLKPFRWGKGPHGGQQKDLCQGHWTDTCPHNTQWELCWGILKGEDKRSLIHG